jgi:putative PIN family toxin of toxin-antitoxin system
MMIKPRVVFDPNILVSELLSPSGNLAQVLNMFMDWLLNLVYSEEIMAEYEDVLFRPRLHTPLDKAGYALAAICRFGERIEAVPGHDDMIDEDDRVFYDTAKIAGAYLITGNKKPYPRK